MHWTFNRYAAQWETSFGGWHASVGSLSTRCAWHGEIRRRYPPYHVRGQTNFAWPSAAREWCEEEIMRLRWQGANLLPVSPATESL